MFTFNCLRLHHITRTAEFAIDQFCRSCVRIPEYEFTHQWHRWQKRSALRRGPPLFSAQRESSADDGGRVRGGGGGAPSWPSSSSSSSCTGRRCSLRSARQTRFKAKRIRAEERTCPATVRHRLTSTLRHVNVWLKQSA